MDRLAWLETQSGFAGPALALALAIAALIALPKDARRHGRGAFLLLLLFAVASAARTQFAPESIGSKALLFTGSFALFASIARSLFVFSTRSRFAHGLLRSWPKILRDVVQALLYFGVAMLALRQVGVQPGSLLTTSALLTAVLGLSMQETLGNLFAGLALQGQRSLRVGDWVRFADGPEGIGEVSEMNWRSTHFLTVNQVTVIVPNGVVARSIIKNYSRPTRLVRHDIDVLAPFDVPPARVRKAILDAIRGTPGLLAEPEPGVIVDIFAENGARYSVRCFLDDYGRREAIEGEVRQRILYAFARDGITIPVPQRRVIAPELAELAGRLVASDSPSRTPASMSERLARFELFRELAPELLEQLARGTKPERYAPGEVIIRQGDEARELFALEQGRLEVVAEAGGERVPIAALEPGELFGEAALLSGEPRKATVVAASEAEVLRISRSAFQAPIAADPALADRLTRKLAERLEALSTRVSEAGAGNDLDADRRSDLLIERIKQFFGR